MSDDLDFYDLLGVDRDASKEEIRSSFRRQVREYHPDLNDDPRAPAQFTALKKAYDTLSDPKERDAYDRLGHDEYVRKRISGIPSPDSWEIPQEDGQGEGEATTTDSTGQSRSERSVNQGGSRERRQRSATRSRSRSRSSRSGSGGSPNADSGSGSSRTAGGTSSRSHSSGRNNGSRGRDSGAPGSNGASRNTRNAATASGNARTNVGATGTASGTAAGGGSTRTTRSSGSSTASSSSGLRERLRWLGRVSLGWPMITVADSLYVAGLTLYLLANRAGLELLVDRLAAAGTDLGAIATVLESNNGVGTVQSFVQHEVSAGSPVAAIVLLAGFTFFPTVYLDIIRRTRRMRTPWQPSYLYAIAAAAPIAGLVANTLFAPPGLYVEVVCYGVLPLGAIALLPFSAFVRPKIRRAIRRLRH